ncbi:MAG: hypothetical protein HC860_16480 [Alkalinema sp. RU_4_3]|nr:hypothetical protein [Alkalinema sp. RU_4_3]
MKSSTVKALTVACGLSLATIATTAKPSYSQSAGFSCDNTSGAPTTVYQNRQGVQEPWIKWVSDAFSSSGYSPLTRCREVSGRLETYRASKKLKYITVGMMNRQPVVCTASQVNGRCEGLIFTLKPNQDAVRTLNNLLAWREGQAATPSLRESGEVPYIDVSGRLQESGSEMAPKAPAAVPATPEAPSAGGSREL